MTGEEQTQFVAEIKTFVTNSFQLATLDDEELQSKIEDCVTTKLAGQYVSIDQRISIVEDVFSSIRGFGILDSIIKDDDITEVMINGADNIFIEKKANLLYDYNAAKRRNTYVIYN